MIAGPVLAESALVLAWTVRCQAEAAGPDYSNQTTRDAWFASTQLDWLNKSQIY